MSDSRRDDLAEKVTLALTDVWPDIMTAPTGSGLQFGQLVAHAAITALEVDLRLDTEPEDAVHCRT